MISGFWSFTFYKLKRFKENGRVKFVEVSDTKAKFSILLGNVFRGI